MIAVVDYEAGNLASVARALEKIGRPGRVTGRPEEILAADRVIFPGVGAAGAAMATLNRTGLAEAVREVVRRGTPLLGICLGTQIILGFSHENQCDCLGIVNGEVRLFPPDMKDNDGSLLKIPHMGWNTIRVTKSHPVLAGVADDDGFYFVHSYYPAPESDDNCLAITDYGLTFASVMGQDNVIATQFHPEKSGRPGLRILENFCGWSPC
jgi:glutamine amidotransferase